MENILNINSSISRNTEEELGTACAPGVGYQRGLPGLGQTESLPQVKGSLATTLHNVLCFLTRSYLRSIQLYKFPHFESFCSSGCTCVLPSQADEHSYIFNAQDNVLSNYFSYAEQPLRKESKMLH